MRIISFLVAVLFLTAVGQAQPTISFSDLLGLVGEWEGTLTYTDELDDTTRVTVPARFSAGAAQGKLITRIVYKKSNGENVLQWGEWQVSGDGRRILIDDKTWFVSNKRVTENGTTLMFQGGGVDNNRSAHIIHGMYIGHQDSVVMTKQVLYNHAGTEILRQHFRLGRDEE